MTSARFRGNCPRCARNRSASLYTVSYHYYEAGNSLSQCGDAVSYLACDSGLEEIFNLEKASNSDKCGACKQQLSMASSSGQ